MNLRRLTVVLPLLAACEEDLPALPEPLPTQPQLFTDAFIVFPVIESDETSDINVVFTNNGQGPLVFDSFAIQGSNLFTMTPPSPARAESTQSLVLPMTFDPSGRGVVLATLQVESNAGNFPSLPIPIIGRASAATRPNTSDIAVYEDPTPVDADSRQAIVRFTNLGRGSLVITSYELDDGGGAFAFAGGVVRPTEQNPVILGAGGFTGVTITLVATSGRHSGTLTIRSNDPDEPVLTVDVAN